MVSGGPGLCHTARVSGRPADEELRARLRAGEACVAGVLSGTSADGIDVALTRPRPGARPELLAFATTPFPPELARRVRAALDGALCGLREAALLHRDLGRAFGRAVRALAAASDARPELVGSHGQTVYHHDGDEPSGPATLQLGDGDFVAAEAGAPCVSDFRQADVAAGGEGAPLSALVDAELYPDVARPAAVLNLGGIANVTLLPGRAAALAFDVGPANALLDGLARLLLGRSYDEDGASAARGRPDAAFVAELLRHPFFERAPPKSTGRDTFGEPWVEALAERARARGPLVPDDLLATAVELVAASVVDALERFADPRPTTLVVAGGGARNAALVRALARRFPGALVPSEAAGVPADAREALVFALLAARFVQGEPSTDPAATGARRGVVLGKLSRPEPLASPAPLR